MAHPYSVDTEECQRFVQIFDSRGDGVIHEDEFLEFARFLCVMSFLHSPEGKIQVEEGMQVLEDSMKIDSLIGMLQTNRRNLHKVIAYLPDSLREELFSERLRVTCVERFSELDVDRDGVLDARELYPVIISLAGAHSLALDLDQCDRFTSIFDDEENGVISRNEFVNLSRFLMVMAFLKGQDAGGSLPMAAGRRRGAGEI